MTATGLVSPAEAMQRIRCAPLRLGQLIDAGLIGAFYDRVSGQWHICAGSVAAYLRQKPTDTDLDALVSDRTEARQAEVIRLSERTFVNVRGLS